MWHVLRLMHHDVAEANFGRQIVELVDDVRHIEAPPDRVAQLSQDLLVAVGRIVQLAGVIDGLRELRMSESNLLADPSALVLEPIWELLPKAVAYGASVGVGCEKVDDVSDVVFLKVTRHPSAPRRGG